eukprot:gene7296-5138_t
MVGRPSQAFQYAQKKKKSQQGESASPPDEVEYKSTMCAGLLS